MSQRNLENQSQKKSRTSLSIILLAIIAAMVGFAAYFLVQRSVRSDIGGNENNSIKASHSSLKELTVRQPELVSEEKPKEKREIHRLRTEKQRQELIAAIKLAREARKALKQRFSSSDVPDSEEEKAEHAKFKASVKDAIRAIREDVEDCFDLALEDSPDLAGTLLVQFEYEGEPNVGAVVHTAKIMDQTAKELRDNTKLTKCIIDTIYTLKLPEPEAGGNTIVTYPFKLHPEGEN